MPKVIEGMPKGVRLRGKKYFWDVSVNGARVTGTADSLEQAVRDREAARKKVQDEEQQSAVERGWTLKKAFDGALLNIWNGKASIDTVQINAQFIFRYFGEDTNVNDIDEEAIDEFRSWLRKQGNTNGTINRKTSVLTVILKYAYTRKGLARLPYISRLKENNIHERYITREEEERMISTFYAWGKYHHMHAVIVLIDTGLRSGELFSLAKADVDFTKMKHGIINIWGQNTKTKKSRTVPLTLRAASSLKWLMENSESTTKLLPYDRHWLRPAWERMKEHIGLGDCKVFTPHLLRHTFGSRLAQKGVPLQKIGYIMGHTTPQTTMRYAHLSPQSFDGITDLLEVPSTNLHDLAI